MIAILAAHELTDMQRAAMFSYVKNGREIPCVDILLAQESRVESPKCVVGDNLRSGITSAAPGSAERIAALESWYACHEELSAFDDEE